MGAPGSMAPVGAPVGAPSMAPVGTPGGMAPSAPPPSAATTHGAHPGAPDVSTISYPPASIGGPLPPAYPGGAPPMNTHDLPPPPAYDDATKTEL